MILQVKKCYKILGFEDDCPIAYRHRLLTLGFIPGATFRVIGNTIFGDPFQIKIKNTTVSIRKKDLTNLKIELL
jgi:ferrous iron transport protein A